VSPLTKLKGIALLSAVAVIGFVAPDVSAGCGDGTGCCPTSANKQTSSLSTGATQSARLDANRVFDRDFQRLSKELNLDLESREKVAEIWERRNEQRREITARHTVEVNWIDQMVRNNAPAADLNRQIAKIDSIEQDLRNVESQILNEIKLAIGVQKTAIFIAGQGQVGINEAVEVEAEAFGGGLYRESAPTRYQFNIPNPTGYHRAVEATF